MDDAAVAGFGGASLVAFFSYRANGVKCAFFWSTQFAETARVLMSHLLYSLRIMSWGLQQPALLTHISWLVWSHCQIVWWLCLHHDPVSFLNNHQGCFSGCTMHESCWLPALRHMSLCYWYSGNLIWFVQRLPHPGIGVYCRTQSKLAATWLYLWPFSCH